MTTVLQYLVIAAVIALLLFGLALMVFGRGERLAALPARTSPAQLPERGIEGADVRRVRFALALRGYRMSDVDWTLDRLADELDSTRQELAELSATVATGPAGRRGGAEQNPAEQNPAEQSRADLNHSELDHSELDRTEPTRGEQNQAGTDPSELDGAELNHSELDRTELDRTERDQVEEDRAGSNENAHPGTASSVAAFAGSGAAGSAPALGALDSSGSAGSGTDPGESSEVSGAPALRASSSSCSLPPSAAGPGDRDVDTDDVAAGTPSAFPASAQPQPAKPTPGAHR